MLSVSAATNHPDTDETVLQLPKPGRTSFVAIADTRPPFIEGLAHV